MACSGTGPWLRMVAGAQPGVAAVRFMGCSVRSGSRRGPLWSSRQPMNMSRTVIVRRMSSVPVRKAHGRVLGVGNHVVLTEAER